MKQKGQNPPSFSQQQLYSHHSRTHGAGAVIHFPIWALGGVTLFGAEEFSISHKLEVWSAQLLPR